jgi:selenide,water dikinase
MGDGRTTSRALWRQVEAGGCARKLPAGALRELAPWIDLESDRFMEDAAVVTVGTQVLVQTIDFITPLVPGATDFGRIAAANAMSDVFVAGARPVTALAVACVPLGDSIAAFAEALQAARLHLAQEGCELVGGHSVIDAEPKLGFAITGTTSATGRLLGPAARPHDVLLLTKPIGVGFVSSAYKAGEATDRQLDSAIEVMVQPNSCVPRLAESPFADAMHAATDVTGFGLLAHVAELCRRSGIGARVELGAVPLVDGARHFAEKGVRTSAFATNLDYIRKVFGVQVDLLSEADQAILTDPQTSGGAVIALDRAAMPGVLDLLNKWAVNATVIGETVSGSSIEVS